jgi:hypothetical protein
MPSKSAKQHRFMEAVAHNPQFAKKVGVPSSVGEDFSKADKGKFNRGGTMRNEKRMAGGGKPSTAQITKMLTQAAAKSGANRPQMGAPMRPPMAPPMAPPRPPMAPPRPPMAPPMGAPAGAPPGMKHGGLSKEHHKHLAEHHLSMAEHHHAMHSKGGKVKKMAKGGIAEDPAIERGERHLKHGEHAVQERGYTKAREFKMPGGSTTGMKRGGMPRFAEGGLVGSKKRYV